jgi:guanylate kinase
MSTKKILILCGKSSSGKDSTMQKLISDYPKEFTSIVSHTSRPQRINEIHGREYFFTSTTEIEAIATVESREYFPAEGGKWTYAISEEELLTKLNGSKVPVVILDLQGTMEMNRYLRKMYGNSIDITVINIESGSLTRLWRSFKRQKYNLKSLKEIFRRLKADDKDFRDVHLYAHFTIENRRGCLKEVTNNIRSIVMWDKYNCGGC